MSDHSKWDIPADLIATDRANYYVAKEGEEKNPKINASIFKSEYKFTMEDNSELIDWAANNMNWDDVQDSAVCVEIATIDYQEGWFNGDKEIIEK